MGDRLKAPFVARVKGGGVLTYIGAAVGQTVYWMLSAIDSRPGMGPWPPVGTLRWQRLKTDKSRRSTNIYLGPEHTPKIRVGMHYKVGECKVGQPSGLWDRVTVKTTG
ncbi:MAG: hypothetical protein ACOZF2_06245 [Thermodesulfobacteriota bacterium]